LAHKLAAAHKAAAEAEAAATSSRQSAEATDIENRRLLARLQKLGSTAESYTHRLER